jgi:hypothetical protein
MMAAAFFSASCSSSKSIVQTGQSGQGNVPSHQLKTRIRTVFKPLSKDSVMLSFTVINNTGLVQRFCKWETPFEPRLGKYFEVKDSQGNEALFTGAMARRVMPPPPEAYIEVPAHDSVQTEINLARHYTLKAAKYKITYTGGGVSGLEAGNTVTIVLP